MMRALALAGLIAIGFAAGSAWGAGGLTWFSVANAILGALCLLAGVALALRRARGAGAPAFRGVVWRGGARIAVALLIAIGLVEGADLANVQLDWTFQHRYELSGATKHALHSMCGQLQAILFEDPEDPRIRSTRLLLRTMARTGCLHFEERILSEHPGEANHYGVGSSNTVVLRRLRKHHPEEAQVVERPGEGTLYEALYHLRGEDEGLVWLAQGAGEGNPDDSGEAGFSGLAAALVTEGYRLQPYVTATAREIPAQVRALIIVGPRRPLRPEGLAAIEKYLETGGRLVAFLDPGTQTGMEKLLARWGMRSPNAVVVDPASGRAEGDPAGLNPVVYSYNTGNPIARDLNGNRMTFFRGARPFVLHKPRPDDDVEGIAYTSPRSWVDPHPSVLQSDTTPSPPPGTRTNYHPVVAAGRYRRNGHDVRIVAFGDSAIASNRYLRTLYNLDLVMNSVHWVTAQEPEITIRPKAVVSGRMQFPLPLQNTFTMFQSLGLLIPEILLISAAVIWARRQGA